MRPSFLIFGLIASPALAADQFDLACKLEAKYSESGKWKPEASLFHIDLGKNRWCEGDCSTIDPIASVQPAYLDLRSQDNRFPRRQYNSLRIDRASGKLSHLVTAGSFYMERRGECKAEPFTGFPQVAQKF